MRNKEYSENVIEKSVESNINSQLGMIEFFKKTQCSMQNLQDAKKNQGKEKNKNDPKSKATRNKTNIKSQIRLDRDIPIKKLEYMEVNPEEDFEPGIGSQATITRYFNNLALTQNLQEFQEQRIKILVRSNFQKNFFKIVQLGEDRNICKDLTNEKPIYMICSYHQVRFLNIGSEYLVFFEKRYLFFREEYIYFFINDIRG